MQTSFGAGGGDYTRPRSVAGFELLNKIVAGIWSTSFGQQAQAAG
jgi:hypothetical protein